LADDRVSVPLGRFNTGYRGAHVELAIMMRTTGLLIGGLDIQGRCLSYFIASKHWKKGYGFEAVNAACAYWPRRLRLSSLYADIKCESIASRLILEKVGFRFSQLIDIDISSGTGLFRYKLNL
jgi:RimJ/RimL family protein N-acetyltransferase